MVGDGEATRTCHVDVLNEEHHERGLAGTRRPLTGRHH